ncbi:MAG TPA: hypothetical protein PKY82_03160 [Pyrinomonadaceae bacterium]|nr:hypothetical protein [Pyrinomonadaceae bacterium]
MRKEFIPIYYCGFWDVPHAFLTEYKGQLFYFQRGYFDDELDDYPPNYQVYIIENGGLNDFLGKSDLPIAASYSFVNIDRLEQNKIIGEIPTRKVIFDETNRKFINSVVFKIIQKIDNSE